MVATARRVSVWRWLARLLVAPLLVIAATAVVASPSHAAVSCPYQVLSTWTTPTPGFTAQITIRNQGTTATNAWTLALVYRPGVSIVAYWNMYQSIYSNSYGAIYFNAPWNGVIQPGGSVVVGVTATKVSALLSSSPETLICQS